MCCHSPVWCCVLKSANEGTVVWGKAGHARHTTVFLAMTTTYLGYNDVFSYTDYLRDTKVRPESPGDESLVEEPCRLHLTGLAKMVVELPLAQCWRRLHCYRIEFAKDPMLLEKLGLSRIGLYRVECSCKCSIRLSPMASEGRRVGRRCGK